MLGSWTVRLVEHVPGVRFRDETVSGPMRRFDHTHAFEAARRGTWVIDEIDYHVGPDGPLGVAVDAAAGLAMRAIFVMRGGPPAPDPARLIRSSHQRRGTPTSAARRATHRVGTASAAAAKASQPQPRHTATASQECADGEAQDEVPERRGTAASAAGSARRAPRFGVPDCCTSEAR